MTMTTTGIPPALTVATDGGCNPNPGPGGWAWVAEESAPGEPARYGAGSFRKTTNNIAELTAIKEVLLAFPDTALTIEFDSQYAKKCVTEWGPNWRRQGEAVWSTKKNVDLIFEIIDILEARTAPVFWRKVKAHARDNRHPLNTAVDKLASRMSSIRGDTREEGTVLIDRELRGAASRATR